ncbi:DUF1871 family protein [Paenibacillus sp. HJL G12]|uniref:DUF1871 family protein n=1 Tax=Paenibacillus dendrobii TaxID=2691084 RepID=A0A7X3IIV5_9BACL|nr:DUF1871 family protein [Paenibacillus dendrobii]MWV43395.1 DUF1871 family protein [Paenibacillus dendrobii]
MTSILKILSNWDPLYLMSHAPDDEYSGEEQLIEDSLLQVHNERELGLRIQEIFTSQFDDDFKKSLEEYCEIAKRILSLEWIITVKLKGECTYLLTGRKYKFTFKDPEISFNNMVSVVEDIFWYDEDSNEKFFYIYVLEQGEDYLVSENEIIDIKDTGNV